MARQIRPTNPPRPEHMGLPVDELTERVTRAMIEKYNDALDRHVRPFTYEEALTDPRYGTIQAARAAIATVRDWDRRGSVDLQTSLT